MKGLRIAASLTLPLDWITLSTVVYGARGSGKTTLGRVMAEEAHRAGQRFCAIDLKGDWWGLKSSADGLTDGMPVVIFGGDHADLPLEAEAGAFVAETVAGLKQPVVLDLEHLSKSKQLRFLAAFFERLYDRNRDPLLLLLDEAQRYAAQRPMTPEATICLGAVEDLVKLGRKHGIGPVLFTQRGSGLNKEVSELCDLLVAFRTPGPLDQDRIKDWLDANATREQRDTVMGSLAGMATGTAVFASGHPGLKLFQTAAVRLPDTFDSSATPKVGTKPKVPKRLAAVDLEALRARMAEAITRAEQNDPAKLRAAVAHLTRQKADLERLVGRLDDDVAAKAVEILELKAAAKALVEVPVLDDADRALLVASTDNARHVAEQLATIGATFGRVGQSIADALRDRQPAPEPRVAAPTPRVAPAATPRPIAPPRAAVTVTARDAAVLPRGDDGSGGDATLPRVQRAILTTLAQWPEGRNAQQVGIIAGYSATAGGFRNALGALRSAGWIEGANAHLRITPAGRAAVGPVDPAPTGPDLLAMWMEHPQLGKAERAIVAALARLHPHEATAQAVGELTNYSHTAGGFRNALGKLRTLGLIEGPNAAMRASADLV